MTHLQHPDGFYMATGLPLPLILDPRAQKYGIAHLWAGLGLDVTAVDPNQPRTLANFAGRDCRVPVTYQGNLGACASFASDEAARMAANAAGWNINVDDPQLNVGLIYELARVQEGSFPADAGSNPADCLSWIVKGMPLNSDMPYTAQAGTDYRAVQTTDVHKYLLGFSPFAPQDGNFLGNIAASLDLGHAVVIAGLWPNQWFNPDDDGILPSMAQVSADAGHAFVVYGRLNVGGRWLWACTNHWSPQWNQQVANIGLRPGDFAIDDQSLAAMCQLAWSVVGLPANNPNPNPNPQPQPQPQPNPIPVMTLGGPYQGTVGQPVTFKATLTPEVSGWRVFWNFGDGGTAWGEQVQHTYNAAANWQAVATLATPQNLSGGSKNVSCQISNQPQPQPSPHYVPVGDCVPFWQYVLQYPIYIQAALDIWGPARFHPRGCA